MGLIRTGVGASLVAAPAWAGRIWVGDGADGPGTKVFARALGARDVLLGGAILAAAAKDDADAAGRLVKQGVLVDIADVVATVIAHRQLEGSRRFSMPAVATAVAALGSLAWLAADSAQDSAEDSSSSKPDPDPDEGAASAMGIVDQQDALLAQLDGSMGDHVRT